MQFNVYIIKGYDEGFEPEPEKAELPKRISVVFDTFPHPPEPSISADQIVPVGLNYMIGIVPKIECDLIQIKFQLYNYSNPKKITWQFLTFSNLGDYVEYLKKLPKELYVPFETITFFQNKSPICIAESENYWAFGGPRYYHDSFTIAFYAKDDLYKKLEKLLPDECVSHGYNILAIVDQLPSPKKKNPFVKFLRKIFQ